MRATQPPNRLRTFFVESPAVDTPQLSTGGWLVEIEPGGRWALRLVTVPCVSGKAICAECHTYAWRWVARA